MNPRFERLAWWVIGVLLSLAALVCLWFFLFTEDAHAASYGETSADGTYSLQGLWHLNDNSSTESDDSGNNNDGTVDGAAYSALGKFGGSYYFDWSDTGTITISGSSFSGALTTCVWVNHSDVGKYGVVVGSSNGVRYFLYILAGEEVAFRRGGSVSQSHFGSITGAWHFFTVVRDSSDNIYFYQDGRSLGSSPGAVSGTIQLLSIGAYPNKSYEFSGYIDEVAVYDREFTADEIRQYYGKQRGQWGIM